MKSNNNNYSDGKYNDEGDDCINLMMTIIIAKMIRLMMMMIMIKLLMMMIMTMMMTMIVIMLITMVGLRHTRNHTNPTTQ